MVKYGTHIVNHFSCSYYRKGGPKLKLKLYDWLDYTPTVECQPTRKMYKTYKFHSITLLFLTNTSQNKMKMNSQLSLAKKNVKMASDSQLSLAKQVAQRATIAPLSAKKYF